MKYRSGLCLMLVAAVCGACRSSSHPAQDKTVRGTTERPDPLLEKAFVLEVLRHVYRWHFDQSYGLEAGQARNLEVWSRRLHPRLDADDRSEYAEMWIPAVKTVVELKRAEYKVPELKLEIDEGTFKVTRVSRQIRPPAPSQYYQIRDFPLQEVRDYLFVTRTNSVPVTDTLRASARTLISDYLNKAHPAPFTQDQICYISPLSEVCNEMWVFWETDRKLLFFSADMDLTNPAFSQISQMRMQVIDLDKDVVASSREVPGSNAFVTKDWVGRLFFNCILYGERIVRTPEEMRRLRSDPAARPVLPKPAIPAQQKQ
jgi:hypothetical protein